MVHPADVLPLSLSAAIIVQGLVFLAVQGTGLRSIFVDSCRAIGQLVFPGKFKILQAKLHRQLTICSYLERRLYSSGIWN
jgi:hypothetical protein